MRFTDETQSPPTWQNVASRESTDPLDFAPYMVIHTKLCPAQVVFKDEPATLNLLRRFRDKILSKTPQGRCWTAFYYRHAEIIAGLLENSPELRRQSKTAVERLLPYITGLVEDKAVNRRAMHRDAWQLIDLFQQKSDGKL